MMPSVILADASFFADRFSFELDFKTSTEYFKFKCSDECQSMNLKIDTEATVNQAEKNTTYNKRLDHHIGFSLYWIIGLIFICLIIGFLSGIWWSDFRSRQRHGGIRIY